MKPLSIWTTGFALLTAGFAAPVHADDPAEVTIDVVEEHEEGQGISESVANDIDLPQREGVADAREEREREDRGMDGAAKELADEAADGGVDREEAQEFAGEAREHGREMEREQQEVREEARERAREEAEEARQEADETSQVQEEVQEQRREMKGQVDDS